MTIAAIDAKLTVQRTQLADAGPAERAAIMRVIDLLLDERLTVMGGGA